MPSLLHEAPLFLIEQAPHLLLDLLTRSLHLSLPPFSEISVGSADHNEVLTLEGRSDKVLVLYEPEPARPEGKRPVLGVITESQLAVDDDKHYAWPFYHAGLRRKLRADVWLVVVTPEEGVARWARQPVPRYHPGSHFVPLVLGPAEIPRVTEEEVMRAYPELAVLSAVIHGNEPGGAEVVLNGLRAADLIAERKGPSYHSLILAILNDASIALLKELMMLNEDRMADLIAESYLGRKAVARAEARAEAEAILTVLLARGVVIGEDFRKRVLSCGDQALLQEWIRRAATATTVDEVVAG